MSFSRYDGQRAQIHRLADGSVRVFSRNGDETTSRFPDVVSIIKESCSPTAATFIVDSDVFHFSRINYVFVYDSGGLLIAHFQSLIFEKDLHVSV